MHAADVRRNDLCPCGSGAKFKRCCLDRRDALVRLVGSLEALVDELGRWAQHHHRREYEVAFAEFYRGGWAAFGLAGPDDDERREADLWLTCDVPLVEGERVLSRAASEISVDPLLSESRLRVWRIAHVLGAGMIRATCPLTGEAGILQTVRDPAGVVEPDRLLVARSVPHSPGRYALLGRVPVVAPTAQGDFEDLLARIEIELHDPDRIWSEAGGQLSAAAWRWPEEREHTREGDIVAEARVSYALRDIPAMIGALDDSPLFERTGRDFIDADVIEWRVSVSRPGWARANVPDDELGVRWHLCLEDAHEPATDARIELNLDHGGVWILAPTPARLERVEETFTAAFGELLGETLDRGVDRPEIVARWQRERWDRSLKQLAPTLRRIRAAA
jgi:hypothetical protein